jgi:pilus assembly protein Flp/PilA
MLRVNFPKILGRNAGQGMVEYGLILALIAIVVIVVLMASGNQIKNLYSDIVIGTTLAGM